MPSSTTFGSIPVGIGRRLTAQPYTEEDIDLLNNTVSQCESALERMHLQTIILTEQAEALRLSELSQLKSYFVSGVTHELKTPLTSIRMFAELLEQYVDADTARQYLKIITGESDRLSRLVENVLDYSRIERNVMTYRRADVSLNDVVHHAMNVMQYQLDQHGFTVEDSMCDADIFVSVDRDALIQAIINLISNAIKYSTNTRKITIETGRRRGFVYFTIRDSGIGVAEGDRDRMFMPFVRLYSSEAQAIGGAGLGLSLVKHFVDAHNGDIDVHSELGVGTTFTISLPTT